MFCIKNMSYKKLAKYGVFSSIIFFSLFIFYNFGNCQAYYAPYDPSFMPPYGLTPGSNIVVNQDGKITGAYSPAWDMTMGAVPGDFITPWGSYPNWENRWLLGAAGMYGPGSISVDYGDYGYGGSYGGYYGNSLYGGYGGNLYGGYGGGLYGGYGGNLYGGYGGGLYGGYGGNNLYGGYYGSNLYGGYYGSSLYGGYYGSSLYGGGLYGGYYGSNLYGGYGGGLYGGYGGYGGLYGLGGMYGF